MPGAETRLASAEKSFQSAPGREAGRCLASLDDARYLARFQSAPGREAGRCARNGVGFLHLLVSIRARP